MDSKKNAKNAKKYICDKCDYITSNKYDFSRHLLTDKHKLSHVDSVDRVIKRKKTHFFYTCDCGRNYKYDSGLYKHRKKGVCSTNRVEVDPSGSLSDTSTALVATAENLDYKYLILKLLEEQAKKDALMKDQNDKLSTIIMEQSKQLQEMIPKIGNVTNNTINNKFNIHIFLNERCKSAISMDDFIKSINISLDNLLTTKDKGLADGISNIFLENMIKLPIDQRPLHCTDIKREILYIKNDTWEKDENNEKIKDAINKVSKKQCQNVSKWSEANPNFMEHSHEKDEYIQLIKHTMDDLDNKHDKIIKTLCKNVHVNTKQIDI